MKLWKKAFTSAVAVGVFASVAFAGQFDGQTLRVKLIGGQQYEHLYTRIADWERQTGGKVDIIAKKNHFELDKEIKKDIAARSLNWCVASNHSSFAPQYGNLYTDLSKILPAGTMDGYAQALIDASTVNGSLQMIPRAQFDVSVLYYQKSLYADAGNKARFKAKYGYDLSPPDTLQQWKDQAVFFADPPNMYGTQYAGKEEAIVGRFLEILVAEGGTYFDAKGYPKFNSAAGQRALQWFKDLYQAGAVPKGTLSYLWDDLGAGFASGTVAINLDWPGWAGYFNDPKQSKVAGNLGVKVQPKGSSGKRTGWSGFHGFSVTEKCANKQAAGHFVAYLTSEQSQALEASKGSLPTRAVVWDTLKANAPDAFRRQALEAFAEGSKYAFAVPQFPEWIESTNIVYPKLQAAILGDMSVKDALDKAAREVRQMMEDNGYY